MHIGKIRTFAFVFTGVPGLMFTKLLAGCGCEIATARSRDGAMVTDLWHMTAKTDTPRLHSVRWRFITDGRITTWIVPLTPPLTPLGLVKIS